MLNNLHSDTRLFKLFEQKQYDKLLKYIDDKIRKNKDIGRYFLAKYEYYTAIKDHANALQILLDSIHYAKFIDHKSTIEILMLIAESYFEMDDHKNSFEFYKRVIHFDNTLTEPIIKILHILIESNQYTAAVNFIKSNTHIMSKNPDFLALIAYLYIKRGDTTTANQNLANIIHSNPDCVRAKFYSGVLNMTLKEYRQAVEFFKETRNFHEFKLESLNNIGQIYYDNGKLTEAFEYFHLAEKSIVFENSKTIEMRYKLHLCYEKENDFHNSLKQLRIIYDIDPDYKDIGSKLISEHYKEMSQKFLLEYDAYTKEGFIKFANKIASIYDLSIVKTDLFEQNNILVAETVNKSTTISSGLIKMIGLQHTKKIKLVLIFIRLMPVKGEWLQNFITEIDKKFDKAIIFSSGEVSSHAMKYAKSNNIKIVIPTFLNDLIEHT